jgi:hypothetical protein
MISSSSENNNRPSLYGGGFFIIIKFMKNNPIYRVIKHTYYEQCDIKREYFTIEKQYKIWKWIWWEKIKETICGMGHCYRSSIKFNNESDAIFAIKKLENGNIADGWREEISTILDFNKK